MKIFVIMPFVVANSRDKSDLEKFFNDYIKHPIENHRGFLNEYSVLRSGNDLSILDKIITDLAEADIVICDLSGELANPNVIYELGIRLSISHKPVILIREDLPSNKHMFDIAGLYTFGYKTTAPRDLERFLIEKIAVYEENVESFESPVLKALNHQAAFWMQLPIRKASAFLGGIASAASAHLKAFYDAMKIFSHKENLSFDCDDYILIYKFLVDMLEADAEKIETMNYKVSRIPSLDSYLSSVYLLGLVDDDVEKRFREYAMSYSLSFNEGNSPLFSQTKREEYLRYTYETLILMNTSRLIIKLLAAKRGSEASKSYKEQFFSTLKNSKIVAE